MAAEHGLRVEYNHGTAPSTAFSGNDLRSDGTGTEYRHDGKLSRSVPRSDAIGLALMRGLNVSYQGASSSSLGSTYQDPPFKARGANSGYRGLSPATSVTQGPAAGPYKLSAVDRGLLALGVAVPGFKATLPPQTRGPTPNYQARLFLPKGHAGQQDPHSLSWGQKGYREPPLSEDSTGSQVPSFLPRGRVVAQDPLSQPSGPKGPRDPLPSGRTGPRDPLLPLPTGRTGAQDSLLPLPSGRTGPRDALLPLPSGGASPQEPLLPLPSGRTGPREPLLPLPSGRTVPREPLLPLPSGGTGPREPLLPLPSGRTGPQDPLMPLPSERTGPRDPLPLPRGVTGTQAPNSESQMGYLDAPSSVSLAAMLSSSAWQTFKDPGDQRGQLHWGTDAFRHDPNSIAITSNASGSNWGYSSLQERPLLSNDEFPFRTHTSLPVHHTISSQPSHQNQYSLASQSLEADVDQRSPFRQSLPSGTLPVNSGTFPTSQGPCVTTSHSITWESSFVTSSSAVQKSGPQEITPLRSNSLSSVPSGSLSVPENSGPVARMPNHQGPSKGLSVLRGSRSTDLEPTSSHSANSFYSTNSHDQPTTIQEQLDFSSVASMQIRVNLNAQVTQVEKPVEYSRRHFRSRSPPSMHASPQRHALRSRSRSPRSFQNDRPPQRLVMGSRSTSPYSNRQQSPRRQQRSRSRLSMSPYHSPGRLSRRSRTPHSPSRYKSAHPRSRSPHSRAPRYSFSQERRSRSRSLQLSGRSRRSPEGRSRRRSPLPYSFQSNKSPQRHANRSRSRSPRAGRTRSPPRRGRRRSRSLPRTYRHASQSPERLSRPFRKRSSRSRNRSPYLRSSKGRSRSVNRSPLRSRRTMSRSPDSYYYKPQSRGTPSKNRNIVYESRGQKSRGPSPQTRHSQRRSGSIDSRSPSKHFKNGSLRRSLSRKGRSPATESSHSKGRSPHLPRFGNGRSQGANMSRVKHSRSMSSQPRSRSISPTEKQSLHGRDKHQSGQRSESSAYPDESASPKKDTPPIHYGVMIQPFPKNSSNKNISFGIFRIFKRFGHVTSIEIHGIDEYRFCLVFYKESKDQDYAIAEAQGVELFNQELHVTAWKGPETERFVVFRPKSSVRDNRTSRMLSKTLFIKNLDPNISRGDIHLSFQAFGKIIEIIVQKKNDSPSFAFVQYSDIGSVTRAIKVMDGMFLGEQKIQLFYAKTEPTKCVWIDRITRVPAHYLVSEFSRYGEVAHVAVDCVNNKALVFFNAIEHASKAIEGVKGHKLGGCSVMVDFANRECQMDFYQAMSSSGQDAAHLYEYLMGDEVAT